MKYRREARRHRPAGHERPLLAESGRVKVQFRICRHRRCRNEQSFQPHISCGKKYFNQRGVVMDLKYAMGAALVAGAFVAIPVIAADTDWTGRAEQGFTRLDTSHDGNIDKTEAQAWPWLQQNFDRFDHDRDAKLGKDEFAAAVNAERTARGDARGAVGAAR